MEVGDWITLTAVVVALGIGVASIIHTNILQRKERRERLLNEIIDWAINLMIEKDVEKAYKYFIGTVRNAEHLKIFESEHKGIMNYEDYQKMHIGKYEYIVVIASKLDKDLMELCAQLSDIVKQRAELYWADPPRLDVDVVANLLQMHAVAYKIIEKANNLM